MAAAKIKRRRRMSWLVSKRDEPSRTAFWLAMVMIPTVVLFWVIVVRLAIIGEEYFVEALAGGGIFSALITFIMSRLYNQGKIIDAPPLPGPGSMGSPYNPGGGLPPEPSAMGGTNGYRDGEGVD